MKRRKIYIATSWKNEEQVRLMARVLRECGHEVFAFCEKERPGGLESFVFGKGDFEEAFSGGEIPPWDLFCDYDMPTRAYECDKAGLDWCDTVVLLLPSGRSSHLEAGYAVGRGKDLVIYGDLPDGEYDVMYSFAQARIAQLPPLFRIGFSVFAELTARFQELVDTLANELPLPAVRQGTLNVTEGDRVTIRNGSFDATGILVKSIELSAEDNQIVEITLALRATEPPRLEPPEPAHGE